LNRETIDLKLPVSNYTVRLFTELLYGQSIEVERMLFKNRKVNLADLQTVTMDIDADMLLEQQEKNLLFLIKEIINDKEEILNIDRKEFVYNLSKYDGIVLKDKVDELLKISQEKISESKKK